MNSEKRAVAKSRKTDEHDGEGGTATRRDADGARHGVFIVDADSLEGRHRGQPLAAFARRHRGAGRAAQFVAGRDG